MSKAVEHKKTAPKEPPPQSKSDGGRREGGPGAGRLSLPDDDYKSVREQFGADEYCYIMDAKNIGNLGRYLNVSEAGCDEGGGRGPSWLLGDSKDGVGVGIL